MGPGLCIGRVWDKALIWLKIDMRYKKILQVKLHKTIPRIAMCTHRHAKSIN